MSIGKLQVTDKRRLPLEEGNRPGASFHLHYVSAAPRIPFHSATPKWHLPKQFLTGDSDPLFSSYH